MIGIFSIISKENKFLFDGGNRAVLRGIQTKEKPLDFVLLENALRFQNDDKRPQLYTLRMES